MRALLAAFIFVLGSTLAHAQEAPLGLQWGMSVADVQKLGVGLTQTDNKSLGYAAVATALPKPLSDAETVVLLFGFNDKLWRVYIASKSHASDRYGLEIKDRFDQLVDLLTAKYGKPQRYDFAPSDDFFSRPSNYAYSISQKQRQVAASWKADGMTIELVVHADYEATYYGLAYENDDLSAQAHAGGKSKDAGAL